LEINANVGGRTPLACLAPPDAIVVFLEIADVGIARILDLGFCLPFGKAVPTGNWLIGIFLIRR
jgi:hypothetical protein